MSKYLMGDAPEVLGDLPLPMHQQDSYWRWRK